MAAPLLAWFAAHQRALPWREEPRDPYRTWVSEVMLQQTRVDVVVPYYRRFLRDFPTLAALAAAPLDAVLARWSGLGYYARGKNLHAAARAALAAHGGLPGTLDGLRALPGFGPYTAAAVASLAFGARAPLVDGNVARVLARLFALPGDPARVRAAAWALAPALLPERGAGAFNEALMELGATVCTPRAPRCGACPLAAPCAARAAGAPERFPGPKKAKARPQLRWAAVALRRADGAVLLAREPARGLFAGLWSLPHAELEGTPEEAARRALRDRGLRPPARLLPVGRVEQTLTHRELSVELFTAPARAPAAPGPGLRWVAPEAAALREVGLSSLAKKTLAACGVPAPGRL